MTGHNVNVHYPGSLTILGVYFLGSLTPRDLKVIVNINLYLWPNMYCTRKRKEGLPTQVIVAVNNVVVLFPELLWHIYNKSDFMLKLALSGLREQPLPCQLVYVCATVWCVHRCTCSDWARWKCFVQPKFRSKVNHYFIPSSVVARVNTLFTRVVVWFPVIVVFCIFTSESWSFSVPYCKTSIWHHVLLSKSVNVCC